MDESNKPLKWKVTNVTQTSGVIDDNSRLFMNALQNLQGNGGEESVSVMCYENTSIGDKTWKVTFTQELTNNTRIVEIKQTACEDVETYAISGCRIYRMSPTVVPASGTSNLRVYYSASTTTTHSCGGSVETGTTSGSTTYSAISANDSTEQRTIPISVSVRWKGKTCTASSSITQSGKACSKTGYTIDCDNVSTSSTRITSASTSATISYSVPVKWHDDCGNSGNETTHSGTKRITFSQNTEQEDREINTSITIQYTSGSMSSNTCTKNITLIQPGTGACVDNITYEIIGCEITNAPTDIPSSGGNINVLWSMTGVTHHTCFNDETEIKTGVSVNIVSANDSYDEKQITLTAQTDSFHGETCNTSTVIPQRGKRCTMNLYFTKNTKVNFNQDGYVIIDNTEISLDEMFEYKIEGYYKGQILYVRGTTGTPSEGTSEITSWNCTVSGFKCGLDYYIELYYDGQDHRKGILVINPSDDINIVYND